MNALIKTIAIGLCLVIAPLAQADIVTSVKTVAATPAGACGGVSDGHPADCFYSVRYDDTRCGTGSDDAKCDNLVIFFAGGDMSCDLTDPLNYYQAQVNLYALNPQTDYYVAIACVMENFFQGDDLPFYREAERVDHLIAAIRAEAESRWNGRNMLIAGISHGAAAVLTGMARTDLDENPYWEAEEFTGVCLFDPPLNVRAREDRYVLDPVPGACKQTRDRNICHRYLGQDVEDCAYPDPETQDMIMDSVDTVAGGKFELRHYKLVAFGGGLNPCSPIIFQADGPPTQPILDTCANINAKHPKSCESESWPYVGHGYSVLISDPTINPGFASCEQWFSSQKLGSD